MAWHVPSPPAGIFLEFASANADAAGKPLVELAQMPRLVMPAAGALAPLRTVLTGIAYRPLVHPGVDSPTAVDHSTAVDEDDPVGR